MKVNRRRLYQVSEVLDWKSGAVAELLGVSQRSIQRWWKREGFEVRKPRNTLTREFLRPLYSKQKRNLTLDTLAEISPWSRATFEIYLGEARLLNKNVT